MLIVQLVSGKLVDFSGPNYSLQWRFWDINVSARQITKLQISFIWAFSFPFHCWRSLPIHSSSEESSCCICFSQKIMSSVKKTIDFSFGASQIQFKKIIVVGLFFFFPIVLFILTKIVLIFYTTKAIVLWKIMKWALGFNEKNCIFLIYWDSAIHSFVHSIIHSLSYDFYTHV